MSEAGRAGKHQVVGRVTLGKQLSGFPSNVVGDVYKEASNSQPISNTAFRASLPFLSKSNDSNCFPFEKPFCIYYLILIHVFSMRQLRFREWDDLSKIR